MATCSYRLQTPFPAQAALFLVIPSQARKGRISQKIQLFLMGMASNQTEDYWSHQQQIRRIDCSNPVAVGSQLLGVDWLMPFLLSHSWRLDYHLFQFLLHLGSQLDSFHCPCHQNPNLDYYLPGSWIRWGLNCLTEEHHWYSSCHFPVNRYPSSH